MNNPLYDKFMINCPIKSAHVSLQMCDRMRATCGQSCEKLNAPAPIIPKVIAPKVIAPNPAIKIPICLKCKKENKRLQRRLCITCYSSATKDGSLREKYPVTRVKKKGFCSECGLPVTFKANGQCKKCYDRNYHRNKALEHQQPTKEAL